LRLSISVLNSPFISCIVFLLHLSLFGIFFDFIQMFVCILFGFL
jgi:hypothetical protein